MSETPVAQLYIEATAKDSIERVSRQLHAAMKQLETQAAKGPTVKFSADFSDWKEVDNRLPLVAANIAEKVKREMSKVSKYLGLKESGLVSMDTGRFTKIGQDVFDKVAVGFKAMEPEMSSLIKRSMEAMYGEIALKSAVESEKAADKLRRDAEKVAKAAVPKPVPQVGPRFGGSDGATGSMGGYAVRRGGGSLPVDAAPGPSFGGAGGATYPAGMSARAVRFSGGRNLNDEAIANAVSDRAMSQRVNNIKKLGLVGRALYDRLEQDRLELDAVFSGLTSRMSNVDRGRITGQFRRNMNRTYGKEMNSYLGMDPEMIDDLTSKAFEGITGSSTGTGVSPEIAGRALAGARGVISSDLDLARSRRSAAAAGSEEFAREDMEVRRLEASLKKANALLQEHERLVAKLGKIDAKNSGGLFGYTDALERDRIMNRIQEPFMQQKGFKKYAHGMNFAMMNAAYGFQDFFQVLAQPGMGVSRAFLAAANNIGPALGFMAKGALTANLAVGGLLVGMSALQMVMQKNEDKAKEAAEGVDMLAKAYKNLHSSIESSRKSMAVGDPESLFGLARSAYGSQESASPFIRKMLLQQSAGRMARSGDWATYPGDPISNPFLGLSAEFYNPRSKPISGPIGDYYSALPKFADVESGDTSALGHGIFGRIVDAMERGAEERRFNVAMKGTIAAREEAEKSGQMKSYTEERMGREVRVESIKDMIRRSSGDVAATMSGFGEATSNARRFKDTGFIKNYISSRFGEMNQYSEMSRRAKIEEGLAKESLGPEISKLEGEIATKKKEKATKGAIEAAPIAEEIAELGRQLALLKLQLQEAGLATELMGKKASTSKEAFDLISGQYKGTENLIGMGYGKTTQVASGDLWSRIQDSLSGGDIEKQQLSVMERLLAAVERQEKVGFVGGHDSGGYAGGGKTPSPRDKIPAMLRAGEAVVTPERQEEIAASLGIPVSLLFGNTGGNKLKVGGRSLGSWAKVPGLDSGGFVPGDATKRVRERREFETRLRRHSRMPNIFRQQLRSPNIFRAQVDPSDYFAHSAGEFHKWKRKDSLRKEFQDAQFSAAEREEPFSKRYSDWKIQSARGRLSGFYKNQGPLYGRASGATGVTSRPGGSVPSLEEAWPGGMPVISPPGVSLGLPRSTASQASFDEMNRLKKEREVISYMRTAGGTRPKTSDSPVGIASEAEARRLQLGRMQRSGASQKSIDAMGRTFAASDAARTEADRRAARTPEQKAAEDSARMNYMVHSKKPGASFDRQQSYLDYRAKGFSKDEANFMAGRAKSEAENPVGPTSSTTRSTSRTNSWMQKADTSKRSPSGGWTSEKESRLAELSGDKQDSYTVKDGGRPDRLRASMRADMEGDRKMESDASKGMMESYEKRYSELPQNLMNGRVAPSFGSDFNEFYRDLPQKLMQNVGGREQAGMGGDVSGKVDRQESLLSRAVEILEQSWSESSKATEKLISAVESSGLTIA